MLVHDAYRFLYFALSIWGGVAYGDTPPKPAHWFISSQHSGEGQLNYDATLDHTMFHSGSSSGLLRSTTLIPNVSGTLMQTALADLFSGKQIRFSAYIKSQDVTGWAGIWFRADDANGYVVAFQNPKTLITSGNEPISGSAAWRKAEIVIQVPASAVAIAYGVQMIGQGAVWIDDAAIEELSTPSAAPAFVPTGARNRPPVLSRLSGPTNLDFEQ